MTDLFKSAKRVIVLAVIVGALPFCNCARVHAQGSQWLDDYSQPVGFTYGAEATVNAMYLWRGLCIGAFNVQPSANVGYGGLYANMWWNIGTADWSFTKFQPEVDIIFGFARWGLDASVMYVYNFNRPFFDFENHPDGGNGLEVRLRYTVSSKLPLSFLWATRVAASDGYLRPSETIPGREDTVRAYSSYAELSYTQPLPYRMSVYVAVGITPWKSFYTGYQRGFAVQNVEVRFRKDWEVTNRCGMMLQGTLSINPSALAADRNSYQWDPLSPSGQSVNANISFGVYLIR